MQIRDVSAQEKQLEEHFRAVDVDIAAAKSAGADKAKIALAEKFLVAAQFYAYGAIGSTKKERK